MKVYTEVVYTWDDTKNELVEESSESFDYEGEVTQCGFGGSFGAAVRNVKRTTKKAAKKFTSEASGASAVAARAGIAKLKLATEKAAKVAAAKVQTGLTSASNKLQTAGAVGLKKAESNIGGLADAGKANLHAATDAGKTNLKTGMDTGKGMWDQARGKGGKKEDGGQAGGSQQAMGSTGSTSEKSGKFGSKGQLSTAKRKRANTGKNKLKVRVA